jgi:hypothetical protein
MSTAAWCSECSAKDIDKRPKPHPISSDLLKARPVSSSLILSSSKLCRASRIWGVDAATKPPPLSVTDPSGRCIHFGPHREEGIIRVARALGIRRGSSAFRASVPARTIHATRRVYVTNGKLAFVALATRLLPRIRRSEQIRWLVQNPVSAYVTGCPLAQRCQDPHT